MRRAAVYVVFSAGLLTLYGGQVCPLLDGLPVWQLLLRFITVLGIMLAARPWLLRRYVEALPPHDRIRRQLHTDLVSFLTAGVLLTLYNHLADHFPLESGFKVLLGCTLLGIFYALDLALQAERGLVTDAARTGRRLPPHFQLHSLTRGFAVVAVLVLCLLGTIFFLIISKDLAWIVTLTPQALPAAERSILIEVVFIVAVMTALAVNLTLSYARNLQLFFQHQTRVLNQIALGQLDTYVPVVGKNEFALIADHTNQMIDALRDKQRVESVLGKVVSPEIARRLLAAGPVSLGGTRRNLVILFSDIRSFTTLSENRSPEEVVRLLNTYFSVMVRLVRQHGGLIDKFLGDGLLAVFGLDDAEAAAARAVRAGLAMLGACRELAHELEAPLEIGIGIHKGDVIAGNVGAPERLEFTFIGDVVNTASRLEGMTKPLGCPLVVSSAVHEELSATERALPWEPLGTHQLKGKAIAMPLFGCRALPALPSTTAPA